VSCLGAINGMVFAGSRIYYAMGTEHRTFSWFGRWNQRIDNPVRALASQALVTIGLVLAFGWYSESNQSGFERLVVFYSPLFWLFFLMSSISLFIFRRGQPKADADVYQVIFYPWTPILFALSCAYLLYSSVAYATGTGYWEGFFTLAILGIGIFVALLEPMRAKLGSKVSS
jgi:APA family basic amino acid/polyamine antiporter